jgi:hypothetical protein
MARAKSVVLNKTEIKAATKGLKDEIRALNSTQKDADKAFAAATKIHAKESTIRAKELAKLNAQLDKLAA